MAQLETSPRGGRHAIAPTKRKITGLGTRIDFTPMVDLGFLLITFFMLSATLANPKTMEINMPYTDGVTPPSTAVPESVAMTILLGKNHSVYYYEGLAEEPEVNPLIATDASNSIRTAIIAKRQKVDALKKNGTLSAKVHATMFIKPDSTSTYADLVAILDEMNINDIQVYTIAAIDPVEQQWLATAKP